MYFCSMASKTTKTELRIKVEEKDGTLSREILCSEGLYERYQVGEGAETYF